MHISLILLDTLGLDMKMTKPEADEMVGFSIVDWVDLWIGYRRYFDWLENAFQRMEVSVWYAREACCQGICSYKFVRSVAPSSEMSSLL